MKREYNEEELSTVVPVHFSVRELLKLRSLARDSFKREERNFLRDQEKSDNHLSIERSKVRTKNAEELFLSVDIALSDFDRKK